MDIDKVLSEIKAAILRGLDTSWNMCAGCGIKKPVTPIALQYGTFEREGWYVNGWGQIGDGSGCRGWVSVSMDAGHKEYCPVCAVKRGLV